MSAAIAGPALHLRRIGWRPKFSFGAAFLGLLTAVGGVVFQQQSGKLFPTGTTALVAVVAGVLVPQVLTNIGRGVAVWRANQKVSRAERILAPRYDAPAPVAAQQPAAAPRPRRAPPPRARGWNPTHAVPAGGLDAWTEPDPAATPVASLDPGLDVVLVETRGAWARVLCENGWEGWTDARELEAIAR
jgi:hypothetical protein